MSVLLSDGCSACKAKGAKLAHPVVECFSSKQDRTKCNEAVIIDHLSSDPGTCSTPLGKDYMFFQSGLHSEVKNFLETTHSSMVVDSFNFSFMWFELWRLAAINPCSSCLPGMYRNFYDAIVPLTCEYVIHLCSVVYSTYPMSNFSSLQLAFLFLLPFS